MVEQLGSGVPRILRAYPKECFHFGDSFLRITIPKAIVEADNKELVERLVDGLVDDENSTPTGGTIGGTIGGAIGGQSGGQTGETGNVITERQEEVLNLIVENNRISRKEIAKALGIAESAVQKHLKALIDAKAICREGTYKGYWKILRKS